MHISKKKSVILALITVFFIIIDRLLKNLAYIRKDFLPVNIFENILRFNYIENSNIAFSIPLKGSGLNILIGLILALLIIVATNFFKKKFFLEFILFFSVFLGGASNYYDRIKYGFVIDYLYLKYFTVFNISDTIITISVFLYIYLLFNRGSVKGAD